MSDRMKIIVDALLHLQHAFMQAGLAPPAVVLGEADDEWQIQSLAAAMDLVKNEPTAIPATARIAGTDIYVPADIRR